MRTPEGDGEANGIPERAERHGTRERGGRDGTAADGRTRLGILQCGHTPEELLERHANYPDMFVELLGHDAFDYRVWTVVDGELPPGADAADAWLITGSRHGAYEPHDWIPPLEALVREIRDVGSPLVGICFGHQIIAQALGGRVEKHAGGWSIGRVEYRLEPMPSEVTDAQRNVPLMAFHQDQVVELPPGAVPLGESDFCRYAAFAIGDSIRTLQPHPEFDAAFVGGLLDARSAIVPAEPFERARASLVDAADVEPARAGVAAELREFLRGGRRGGHGGGERRGGERDEDATDATGRIGASASTAASGTADATATPDRTDAPHA